MSKPNLTLFTNLYPNPWQPNRATFNQQQYKELEKEYNIHPVVPVPWIEFIKNYRHLKNRTQFQNVLYFPFFYVPGFFRRLNALFMVLSILISIKPAIALFKSGNVIASWAFPDASACSLLQKLFGFNLYIQCLGSDVNFHSEQAFKRSFLRAAFKKASAVITVSKALESKVKEIAPTANAFTAYNGVNFNKFTLKTDSAKTQKLTFIGNLIPTKGVHELLTAFEMLVNEDNRFTLQFIGSGPERDKLEARVKKSGLENNVIFHGSVFHENVVDLLKDSDMLVLPSYREGVPNVIMESFACGIPVVATKVGGIPEVLNDQNGILINTYEPIAILQGIKECYDGQWDSKTIRQSIDKFTWESNRLKLIDILSKTVKE